MCSSDLKADAARALSLLRKAGEAVYRIGEIARRKRGEAQTVIT